MWRRAAAIVLTKSNAGVTNETPSKLDEPAPSICYQCANYEWSIEGIARDFVWIHFCKTGYIPGDGLKQCAGFFSKWVNFKGARKMNDEKDEFEITVSFTVTKGGQDFAAAQFDWAGLDKPAVVGIEAMFLKVVTDLNSISKANLVG